MLRPPLTTRNPARGELRRGRVGRVDGRCLALPRRRLSPMQRMLLSLVTAVTALSHAASLAAAQQPAGDSARLHQLFATNWRYRMTSFPEFATAVGYPGQNARWTDNSLQAIERRNHELQDPLAAIRAIDRAQLSPSDRLSYDLFRRGVEEDIDATRFKDEYLAITQLGGVQQDVELILSLMPKSTVKDYEDLVARL